MMTRTHILLTLLGGSLLVAVGQAQPRLPQIDISVEERQKIEQAIPAKAVVPPAKPRKLLIFDLNVGYGGHRSMPYANLAFTLMGKKTGAFETVVSRDPSAFRPESLKQFDAVFFNNTVGNLFEDPALRQGLLEFVRSGHGLLGVHGTSVAFTRWPGAIEDWPEFGLMLGARGAAHRESNEHVTIKLDDPEHPLNQPFGGKGFEYRDEFFRFHAPYSREQVRVLLSIDTQKTDLSQGLGRGKVERADNDYALAWVRSYGRGRVFYCTIAHNPQVFWDPLMLKFYLGALQFALGDLPAPTTPSRQAAPATSASTATSAHTQAKPAGTTDRVLYNGIELPEPWPSRAKDFPDHPQRPPYLASPPKLIPIDVGRQLFVDDFLIDQTSLKRTFHQPEYYAGNPVLKPDQPWESMGRPYAMPFSDGVWYDAKDGIFKMWYYAGHSSGATCYATSKDGIRWDKPKLDVEPGTNVVLKGWRDSGAVWIDPNPRDPGERFKMALYKGNFTLYRSPDGIHWTKAADGAKTGDRSTFFYNPFRQRWVFSIRSSSRFGRSRLYWETADFFSFSDAAAAKGEAVVWMASDSADPPRDDLQIRPQLYNLDCAAYESVLLGLFSIWRGDYRSLSSASTEKAKELFKLGRPKQNSVCVGFSRDGFHWDRADRRPFMPVSEKMGDWNWGNLQSTVPCCLIVGDQLWFYVSGRAGKSFSGSPTHDAAASTGLAKLRRDGFASMDAAEPGTLTTRPVRFRGTHLFVNLDAPEGELRVEVLDEQGQVIAPFDREHCRPVRGNSTRQAVTWEGAKDLSSVAGKPVQLRFHLTRGSLYAFWVTPDPAGASYGYLVGGGPGLPGPVDVPSVPSK